MLTNFKAHGPPPWVSGAAAVGFKFEDLPMERTPEDDEQMMERMFAELATLPGGRVAQT